MNKDQIHTFVTTLLEYMEIEITSINVEDIQEHRITVQIDTPESGKLIGAKGETLRALNHLVKKACGSDDTHISVDINGYRSKKEEEIRQTARVLAERARSLKYNVEMTPMSSYERMLVHDALTDEKNITTESHGEGRERRVVIRYSEEN